MSETTTPPTIDFLVENGGPICLVRPLTKDAWAWLDEHCPEDNDHQYFGGALVVEPRYLEHLLEGITGDGLTLA